MTDFSTKSNFHQNKQLFFFVCFSSTSFLCIVGSRTQLKYIFVYNDIVIRNKRRYIVKWFILDSVPFQKLLGFFLIAGIVMRILNLLMQLCEHTEQNTWKHSYVPNGRTSLDHILLQKITTKIKRKYYCALPSSLDALQARMTKLTTKIRCNILCIFLAVTSNSNFWILQS